MIDLTPADIVPVALALVAAFAAMLFARRRNDARPFSLVAAVLYAIAGGCLLLAIISWSSRFFE